MFPDYDFGSFREITPDFLKKNGINALMCDIDNTLVPYETAEPTEEICNWINDLRSNGIKIVFVSNNGKERVELFCKKIKADFTYKSGKPLKKAVRNALSKLGTKKEETAVLGDQLLTDVLTAHFSKMKAIWVPSIKKVNTPFFRFKGMIEKPFIKSYLKRKTQNA